MLGDCHAKMPGQVVLKMRSYMAENQDPPANSFSQVLDKHTGLKETSPVPSPVPADLKYRSELSPYCGGSTQLSEVRLTSCVDLQTPEHSNGGFATFKLGVTCQ